MHQNNTTTTVATTVTFRNTCSTPAPQPSSPQVSPASPLSFSYNSRICYVATSERVALSDELRQLYAVRDRIVRDVLTCSNVCVHFACFARGRLLCDSLVSPSRPHCATHVSLLDWLACTRLTIGHFFNARDWRSATSVT